MIFKTFRGVEVPPLTAQTYMGSASIAVLITNTMKTSLSVVQSRVKLEPRHLPEVAAGGDRADFTGEQSPGDDDLVGVPVLLRGGIV